MDFIKKIKSSIYDPAFYSEKIKSEKDSPFKYFFLLVTIISLFSAIVSTAYLIPKYNEVVNKVLVNIISKYPSNLEVKVTKGMVSTNVAEPYYIKVPTDVLESNSEARLNGFENVLVINTRKNFVVDDFDSYKTFALLTKDSLVTKDKDKITIEKLSKVPDITVNKGQILKWASFVMPYVQKIKYSLFPIVFAGYLIGHISILIYLLLATFLVWLIAKARKIDLQYKRAYRLSVYASTLPILVNFVFSDLLRFGRIPFIFSLIFVLVAIANIKKS
jgi:hypothetical protein